MKKICFFTAVLLLLCFFLSCDLEDNSISYSKDDYTAFELGRFAGLDEDVEWQIVQAYLQKLQSGGKNKTLTINDVWVENYFGVYCPPYIGWTIPANEWDWDAFYYGAKNQTVFAVMMGVQRQNHGTEQQEIGITHTHGKAFVKDGSSIFLWHNEQLYNLEDHHNYPHLLGDFSSDLLFSWDFLKIANIQNGLDFKTQISILEEWGKSMPTPWIPEYYNEMPIHYLGTYNGYIVIFAHISANAGVFHLEIDGIHFYTHSGGGGNRIFAWKEGEIYELPYLYEKNLITRDDLVKMAYNLHGVKEDE